MKSILTATQLALSAPPKGYGRTDFSPYMNG